LLQGRRLLSGNYAKLSEIIEKLLERFLNRPSELAACV
jgi:hypothetical protein